MLLNIAVGVLCWIENNEQLPELKRCLDSLTDFYPVFVINGKWDDIKGNNPRSTPEANDLIESYSNVIHIQSPNRPEFVNRNKYLELSMKWDIDYLFWVDTDEWVEIPIDKEFFERGIEDIFKNGGFCSYLHCESVRHGGAFKTQKLYKYPGFLRHRLQHNKLYFGDREVWKESLPAPRGIIIHHDKDYRTEERETKMLNRNKSNPIH